MAVGDVVNQLNATTGDLNFQPASGVEVVVTSCSGGNNSYGCGIMNGTVTSRSDFSFSGTAAQGGRNLHNMKLCVNNTNYLYIGSNSYPPAFTGIQTK